MRRLLDPLRRLQALVWRLSRSGGRRATRRARLDRIYRRANAAYHDGRHEDAIDLLTEVVRVDPHYPKAADKLAGLREHRRRRTLQAGGTGAADTSAAIVGSGHGGRARETAQRPHPADAYTEVVAAFLDASDRTPDTHAGTTTSTPSPRLDLADEFVATHGASSETASRLAMRTAEQALRHLDGGSLSAATALLQLAHRLGPLSAEAESAVNGALRGSVTRVLEDGDLESVLALSRAWEAACPRTPGPVRLRLEVLRRLTPVQGVTVADLATAPGSSLLVLEIGIDERAAERVIRRFADCEVSIEYRPRTEALQNCTPDVVPILSAGYESFSQEVALIERTDAISADILRSTHERATGDVARLERLDLFDRLSFEFDDTVRQVARRLLLLREKMRSGGFDRVVFLLGNTRLSHSMRAAATEVVGSENVWFVWCSDLLRRVEDTAFPVTDHTRLMSAYEWSPPLPRHPQPSHDAGERPDETTRDGASMPGATQRPDHGPPSPGPIIFIGNPSLRNTQHLASIFESLPGDWRGIGIPTTHSQLLQDNLQPFVTTAERSNGRFSVDTSVCGVESSTFDHALHEVSTAVITSSRFTSLSIDGLPLGPLLGPSVDALIRRRLPVLRDFAGRLSDLLERERPSAVVVTPDRASEARVACTLAASRAIPSIFPQVETFSRSPRFKTLQATFITVVDQDTRTMYMERFGIPDDRIFVTGIPRFDGVAQRRIAAGGEPRPPAARTVLLALQPIAGETNHQLVATVADAVAPLEGVDLLVKLHPGQTDASVNWYRRQIAAHAVAPRASVTKEGDIYDLIEACEVVVSMFSAVVLEAAIYGRLVICASLNGEPLPVPFVEQGVGVGAFSPDELGDRLSRCLYDRSFVAGARSRQDAFFADNPHLREGRATHRIARVVAAIARRQNPHPTLPTG